MPAVSANRLELLQIAEAVAREKTIDKGIVIAAMEDAIQKAARSRYGSETEVRAEINPKTGELRLSRLLLVSDPVENNATQISLEEAKKRNPAAQIGDYIAETLPPLEYGRIAAQSAKQVIVQKVREAERDRQYNDYKDRIGEIVNGVVKRVEYGNVIVDLGRGEAIIRRDEMLPREAFRNGDRARAYVYDVRREPRGPQIFLSRTHPQFMAKLFAQEVPEIYDGIVEIKAVARDPGSRAKIAVVSRDSSVDPVGACVGMRGSRVQAVVNELQGEKIDIIPWSPDVATFVVNALAPAEVVKVVLDEVRERIEVVVPDAQLSLAIGRRGQNVRLASQLTGWDIDILTEQEESERRQKEFAERSKTFIDALDVDEMVAQLLTAEGFASVEELALVPVEELASIEGFDAETAQELQDRAKDYLARQEAELETRRKELGVEDALREVPGVTNRMLVAFGEHGIKTVEDLAGCATDDLLGWNERKDGENVHQPGALEGFGLEKDEAEALVMQARVKAGWIDESALTPPEAEGAAAAGLTEMTLDRRRPARGRDRHR
jgi:N utilization substance protein A